MDSTAAAIYPPTGGVGDKTSLVLAPLLAACGLTVAKMSGRGLGHTGGTVDKLESIPNFNSILGEEAFFAQAKSTGLALTGQSKSLAPADGNIYALRDVSATVDSIPLIASSIMSKKLAGGAKNIVLDVKLGSGAFMPNLEAAQSLSRLMIAIGKSAGRRVRALITNMDEPLGFAIGNRLEVEEAIACLKGEDIPDLKELCLALAWQLLEMTQAKADPAQVLASGAAYETFQHWIAAQGGDLDAFERSSPATDGWVGSA